MIVIPGKIPIRIHPIFWVMAFLLAFTFSWSMLGMFIWVGIIFVSVLIHEFGHALAALLFGQSSSIDLIAFGGVTTRGSGQLKLWQEFVVVAGGPMAGLCLYFCALQISEMTLFKQGLYPLYILSFAEANLFWTLLNLLPVLPLDGGSLLSIILQSIFGERGVKVALFIGMIVAGMAALLTLFINNILAASFFIMYMFDNYRGWSTSRKFTAEDKKSEWQQLFQDAEKDLKLGLRQTAFDKFMLIKNQTRAGILHISSVQHLGEIYVEQGFYSDAYDLLRLYEKRLDASSLFLLLWVSYKVGDFELAVRIGKQAFKLKQDYQTAYLNAQCNALLGNKIAAIGWLNCAIREGLSTIQVKLNHHDFDSIRHERHFQNLYNTNR